MDGSDRLKLILCRMSLKEEKRRKMHQWFSFLQQKPDVNLVVRQKPALRRKLQLSKSTYKLQKHKWKKNPSTLGKINYKGQYDHHLLLCLKSIQSQIPSMFLNNKYQDSKII
ncbi:hypothetical protein LguiB_014344 [Lonicera macranthoides]